MAGEPDAHPSSLLIHSVLWCVFSSLYCVVISWATAVASLQLVLDNDFGGYGIDRVLGLVTSYVGAIGAFLMEVATVCAFLTLVSLGFCIATAADDTTPQSGRKKMVKYGAYAVSGLIVCLQVVVLGLNITVDTLSRVLGNSDGTYRNYSVQSNRLNLVCYVFLMLLSLAVTVWAFLIKFRGFAAKVKTVSVTANRLFIFFNSGTFAILCIFRFIQVFQS